MTDRIGAGADEGSTREAHNHPPNGAEHVEGCPACEQIAEALEVARWHAERAARHAAEDRRWHAAHFAPGGPHERGDCGPVCTFGEW